jgi:hypothetical protein
MLPNTRIPIHDTDFMLSDSRIRISESQGEGKGTAAYEEYAATGEGKGTAAYGHFAATAGLVHSSSPLVFLW